MSGWVRLCRLCRGAQNLLAIDNGKLHYHDCPECKGLGCTPAPPPKKEAP